MTHISKTILACILLSTTLKFCACQPRFTMMMTPDQYRYSLSVYIAEFDGKKCYILQDMARYVCQYYCKTYYDYVPTLPWKNARFYNTNTKQCEPAPQCAAGSVALGTGSNRRCVNMTGAVSPFVDAPAPNYPQVNQVTIICQNGAVGIFLGKTDCICRLGWGSYSESSLSIASPSFRKCNKAVSISAYFPNFRRVYYDEAYDNMWTRGGNRQYWPNNIQWYIRWAKYRVINFFYPIEVQITMVTIPTESIFRSQDVFWVIWAITAILMVMIITCYEHIIRGPDDENK